jgi:hypothetical protein
MQKHAQHAHRHGGCISLEVLSHVLDCDDYARQRVSRAHEVGPFDEVQRPQVTLAEPTLANEHVGGDR